ncbi:hypothetical protein V8C42DRAFT_305931 [Trichoderma barbatum]
MPSSTSVLVCLPLVSIWDTCTLHQVLCQNSCYTLAFTLIPQDPSALDLQVDIWSCCQWSRHAVAWNIRGFHYDIGRRTDDGSALLPNYRLDPCRL